jgi:membrane protease YdiL (CAAX protease family)
MEPGSVPLKSLALATAGLLAIEVLARWTAGHITGSALAFTAVARVLDLAWIGWVVHRWGPGAQPLGIGRPAWPSGLRKGCMWSLGFGAAAAAAYGALRLAGIDAVGLLLAGRPARPADPVLLFLTGGVIAPVAEEVYFRGLVFGYLRRWGFATALLLSTAIFAGLHPSGAGMPLTQLVGGLVFAAAYEKERNLLVPIVIHTLGNLALFSLPYILG